MATIIGSDLEAYLHRQAREQALNLVAAAEEEARQLVAKTTIEIDALRLGNEQRTARMVEEKRRRALAQARLRAKLNLVRRREEIVERLWGDAEARLRDLAAGEAVQRLALIERLIVDSAAQLAHGTLEIQVNATDRTLLDENTLQAIGQHLQQRLDQQDPAHLVLAPTAAPIIGGVIVRQGAQLVDNSLDERLAVAKRSLRDTVYRLLASPQGPSASTEDKWDR
jgi:vacuolar-type H+-ATPase subunit E/Vma4